MLKEKECFKCKAMKPIGEFYKHPRMKDGHLGKCKACAVGDVKKNRKDNLEYYHQYDYVRNKSEARRAARRLASRRERAEHPERVKVWREKYCRNNPERKRAANAVNNAIRDGRMKKPKFCERCGAGGRLEGHHEDYGKPLSVEWLCKKCHGATYSKKGMSNSERGSDE